MNQWHYHRGSQQEGSPFSETKESVEKTILQKRSGFTGAFWPRYRGAGKEDWKKERKLRKGESGENCEEAETEQKRTKKKKTCNHAKAEEITPLRNPGQACLGASQPFGARMWLF